MKIKVTKSSGVIENFDVRKLRDSLMRSGATRQSAELITDQILEEIKPYATTGEIYSLARKYLKRYNHASGLRYTLKKALFRLGPTGYPFEKYLGEILKSYGYEVETGRILQGKCIRHEVDILALKKGEISLFECKYHNRTDRATDAKVALYVHSRFQDLEPVLKAQYPGRKFRSSLATNTRCTSDAIAYANCSGFEILSWRYPKDGGLEKMIEEKKLYPVTVVASIRSKMIETLIDKNIILLKDLVSINAKELQSMLSISERRARALKKQVHELCAC